VENPRVRERSEGLFEISGNILPKGNSVRLGFDSRDGAQRLRLRESANAAIGSRSKESDGELVEEGSIVLAEKHREYSKSPELP
jgi:hypothetical protein